MRRLARDQRYEDAARLRDRIAALEQVVATIGEMTRLRSLRVCLLAPAREPGFLRAFFVAGGRIAATRTLPRGGGAAIEIQAGLAAAARVDISLAAEDADELLLLASFLRRPPPEVRVIPLDAARIDAAAKGVALAA